MTARTAQAHTHHELTYAGRDGDFAFLTSASKSRPGALNTTAIDITDHIVHCDCAGAAAGRRCWHADHAWRAFLAHHRAVMLAGMTDEALDAYGLGLNAERYLASVGGRDLAGWDEQLDEARREWRARNPTTRYDEFDAAD